MSDERGGSRPDRGGNHERGVLIGCSGWSYPHWRGVLYPAAGSTERWLELYAQAFGTVEVNATFYRLPTKEMVARWASTTPEDFCFAVKASRYLTHVKRLRSLREGVARLLERIEPLVASAKLGPVLWQLPPQFARDDERLAAAVRELPPGRHAFELRHESWFTEDVYALLEERGLALVAADRAGSTPPRWSDAPGWAYVRFHGGRGRGGGYTRAELERWAARFAATDADVYAYFNNDWEGLAVRDARALVGLLRSQQVE